MESKQQTTAESRQRLVFAREPVLGRVKTRLAAGIGAAPAEPALARPEWPGLPWPVQPAADSLGERMTHAFAQAFAGGATRVAIIGTDCPGLSAELLGPAFEELRTPALVVGPADDGGYYLPGLTAPCPPLTRFAHKAWSTATVLADTLADAARLPRRVARLPTLPDVDSARDLAAWRR